LVRARRAGLNTEPFRVAGGDMVDGLIRGRDGKLRTLDGKPYTGTKVPKDAKILPDTTPAASFTLIQTPDGQFNFNRRTGQAGDRVGDLAPTADARNESRRVGRVGNIVDAIDELSTRINTYEGVLASVVGEAEKAKARVNLADDTAEYQAVVNSFIPMIARALGHTGVLTELDVQSAKAILPSPGDGKALRDRKMARVRALMASMGDHSGDAPSKQGAVGVAADAVRAAAPTPKKKYELLP
jgi:hypothetical protein